MLDSAKVYTDAMETAVSLDIQYRNVQFPISAIGNGQFTMTDTDGKPLVFGLTGPGHTYILHSLGAYDQRQKFSDYRKQPYEWVEEVNYWAENVAPFEDYVAILVNGKLFGFPKNYNIVDHVSVLEFLKAANLIHRLRGVTVKPYEMNCYLGFNDTAEEIEWGIKVNNGMTGHVTLNFSGYLKIGDWEKALTESCVVKHLSNVPQWHKEFNEFAENVIDVEVDVALLNTPASVAAKAMLQAIHRLDADKLDKVSDLERRLAREFEYNESDNAMSVLAMASQYIDYGRKPLVRGLMDVAYDAVLEQHFNVTI